MIRQIHPHIYHNILNVIYSHIQVNVQNTVSCLNVDRRKIENKYRVMAHQISERQLMRRFKTIDGFKREIGVY